MLTKSQRTRLAILDTAAAQASEQGLESLSIGGLAARIGMSKSGLFAHFGSKEELQLATVDHAADIFVREVITPGHSAPRGVARIWALLDAHIDYIEREVFAGGCFFSTTSMEFKDRPGPVRERIVEQVARWHRHIEHAVEQAQELGELDPAADPRRISFELNAFVQSAKSQQVLFDNERAFDDARAAVRERIESLRAVAAR